MGSAAELEQALDQELSRFVQDLITQYGASMVAQGLENQRAWIDHKYDLTPRIDPKDLF
ncbi:MAG: hypothetical protein AAFV87_15760 [Pseudomonadota bacterium]